jgi:hypothetical protein
MLSPALEPIHGGVAISSCATIGHSVVADHVRRRNSTNTTLGWDSAGGVGDQSEGQQYKT